MTNFFSLFIFVLIFVKRLRRKGQTEGGGKEEKINKINDVLPILISCCCFSLYFFLFVSNYYNTN